MVEHLTGFLVHFPMNASSRLTKYYQVEWCHILLSSKSILQIYITDLQTYFLEGIIYTAINYPFYGTLGTVLCPNGSAPQQVTLS